jgi:hypothetical protein
MSLASQTHFVTFTEINSKFPVTVNLDNVITGSGAPGNYFLTLVDGIKLNVVETLEEVIGL